MARQNIQFKGLRHTPSDITGQDGDLLECVNLVHQNGEMKPLEMPERTQIKGYWDNMTLAAVHNLTDGKKYIFVVYNGVVSYVNAKINGTTSVPISGHDCYGIAHEEIQWVETIGNTLIIGTDKSIHYALYKNGAYKWLGDKLPQPVFEFDFTRESVQVDGQYNGHYINEYDPKMYTLLPDGEAIPGGGVALRVGADGSFISPGYETRGLQLANITNENKKIFRDGIRTRHAQVMSTANHANVFVYPFLIRYAVRMYDGNYAMHSSPILMIPSSLTNPLLAVLGIYSYGDSVHSGQHDSNNVMYTIAHENMQFKGMNLKYRFKGFVGIDGDVADASDWSDIIKGVDLFMSSQIYSYNEGDWDDLNRIPTTFKVFHASNNNMDFGHCYSQNHKISWWDIYTDESDGSPIFDYDEMIKWYYNNSEYHNTYRYFKIPLPVYSENYMMERIKETNLFYQVKKYDLEDLKLSNWTNYKRFANEADSGILTRLETLPTLPDDYVSRSRMTGKVNYNYNQRLVLGNIQLQAPLWYQDAKQFEKPSFIQLIILFKIEKAEKTIYVPWTWEKLGKYDFGHYIYYPDPDCKEAIVSDLVTVRRIPMSEHTGLHGAYALMPELKSLDEAFSTFDEYEGELPTPSTDRYYQMPNTIAMSSVANPFHFPVTNFKDIGRTKVIGIAANTLDVSSGQWGQYPLHVFCSDGIIALMIDGEGKMGGLQAVSADVLREPRGISQPTLIQTGQALLFLTQRGVMALAGTQIRCVSEAMEGRHFNAMTELANVDYKVGAFQNLITRTSDNMAFRDFAASGFLAYDYAHNRVLLLNPNFDYQYVYSMNTGLWSKEIIYTNLASFQLEQIPGNTQSDRSNQILKVKPIHAAVNNYTEMYLQDTDGWLYKTMEVMGENNGKQPYQYGYLVSRPIRFGTDEYKTLTRVLHRYTHYAGMSFVNLALYGSRDGVKYGRINWLRGMSYQYFIFVVYTYLKPNERYSYLSAEFETRLTNKLR